MYIFNQFCYKEIHLINMSPLDHVNWDFGAIHGAFLGRYTFLALNLVFFGPNLWPKLFLFWPKSLTFLAQIIVFLAQIITFLAQITTFLVHF